MKVKEYDQAELRKVPELTPEILNLYAQDDYKYLVHCLRVDPSDPFRILQFLTVRFYPLLIVTCTKYSKMGIGGSWMDLISLAKTQFVMFVFQFKLDSTLYFRQYITTALDRFFCTHLSNLIKRKDLLTGTVSLNAVGYIRKEVLLGKQDENFQEREVPDNHILAECKKFVKEFYGDESIEYEVFINHYFEKEPIGLLAERFNVTTNAIRKILNNITMELKTHIPVYLERQ